jgi:hypothetical protein
MIFDDHLYDIRRCNRLLPDNLSLTLHGTTVFRSTSTTFLGFHIDNLLSWKKHIFIPSSSGA